MELNEFERMDDLQIGGTVIFQDKRLFCFGVDAVLLANYPTIKPGCRVLDLCSGNGIVPLIISAKTPAGEIHAIDILKRNFELIAKSIEYNGLQDKIFPICDDLKNWKAHFTAASFDVVTCNPPYIKCGGGLLNDSAEKSCARHEIFCKLEDVISAASSLLKHGGKFCIVYRPDRLAELIVTLKNFRLEPKRMRFVHSRNGDKATMVLIEAVKSGGSELIVEPPLYVYKNKTEYSDEIESIYGRK